ncbi:hypothetical protein FBQ82_13160 [Anaerolineae bacterium CFX7]|nr:hypothetical protein [Anaerolineae bacterium CFX7]
MRNLNCEVGEAGGTVLVGLGGGGAAGFFVGGAAGGGLVGGGGGGGFVGGAGISVTAVISVGIISGAAVGGLLTRVGARVTRARGACGVARNWVIVSAVRQASEKRTSRMTRPTKAKRLKLIQNLYGRNGYLYSRISRMAKWRGDARA